MTDITATTQPSAGIGPPDMELVRRLVTEVVQRLRAAGVADGSRPASQPAGGGSPPAAGRDGAPATAASGHVLSEAVVTLAVIERVPPGTTRVIVPARAVVTPSAREHAADAGLQIVREPASIAAAPVSRPFLVAQAACAADPKVHAAAIARAVAGAQRLPASGLSDVIGALALHVGRDGARGVLLTGRPALAVAAANRHPGLRAVTGHDRVRVQAAVVECAANLLVLDPTSFSAPVIERLCSDLAHGPDATPPAELAYGVTPSPLPCACQGKHH